MTQVKPVKRLCRIHEPSLEVLFNTTNPTIIVVVSGSDMGYIFSYIFPYQLLAQGVLLKQLQRKIVRKWNSRFDPDPDLRTGNVQLPRKCPLRRLIKKCPELEYFIIHSPGLIREKRNALNILIIRPEIYYTLIYFGNWHFRHETYLLHNLIVKPIIVIERARSNSCSSIYAFTKNYKMIPFSMYIFLERLFTSRSCLSDYLFDEICIRYPHLNKLSELNELVKRIIRKETKKHLRVLHFLQYAGFLHIQIMYTV